MLQYLLLSAFLAATVHSAQVFFCPVPGQGSMALADIGVYVHVSDSSVPLSPEGCIEASPAEGFDHSFIAKKHGSFRHLNDRALSLDSRINAEVIPVPSFIPDVTSEYVVIHCVDEDLEALQTVLFTHQFQALKAVKPRQVAQSASLSATRKSGKTDFVTNAQGSSGRFTTFMNDITGDADGTLNISTRCTYADQHNTAADYIKDQFSALGYESSLQKFTFSRYNTQNVLAIKPGTTRADEVVVIGGHYDSTSPRCATLAPGAVDNAGGCTMAYILAQAAVGLTFERTIHFICFGGEEQGIYGSYHYVDVSKDNVVAALPADMISYSSQYYGVTFEGTTNRDILRLMDIAESNAQEFAPRLQTNHATYSFGSDHVPFQQAGIPAFLFIEMDDTNYPCYHQTCDTMTYVNIDQSMDIIAVAAGTLWDVANGVF